MDAALINEIQDIHSDIKYYEITDSSNNTSTEEGQDEIKGYVKVISRNPFTLCLCDINKNHIINPEGVSELKECSKFLKDVELQYKEVVKSTLGVNPVDAPTRMEAIIEEIKRDYNIRDGLKTWNETYLPYNYEVVDGSLLKTVTKYNRETKETEVFDEVFTSTPFTITSMGRNVDNDNCLVEVTLKDIRNNEHKEWMRQGEIFDKEGIKHLINKGLAYPVSKYKDANEYLVNLYNINAVSLPTKIIASSYGWKDNRSIFVIGENAISKECVSPAMIEGIDDTDIYGTKKGTLEGWVECAKDMLEYPLARIKCYADCTAPILDIINKNNFILHNQESSGGAKTTSMNLSESMFTCPSPWTARSTNKGAGLINETHPHLPIHFDEIGESEDFKSMVYELANPNKRATSTDKQVLRSSKRYKTVIQTTGEISLTDDTSFEGEHVRVVTIRDKIPQDSELVEKVENGIKNNYGHIGELYIQKVIQKQDSLREKYEKFFKDLPDYDTAQASRRKSNFAAMIVAGYILEEVFDEIGIACKNPYEICKDYFEQAVKDNAFKPQYLQMLQNAYDWYIENINQFEREAVNEKGNTTEILSECVKLNRRVGWYSEEYIDFIPGPLQAQVPGVAAVYKRWYEEGITEIYKTASKTYYKARPYKILEPGKKPERAYVVRIKKDVLRWALDLQSDEDQDEIPFEKHKTISDLKIGITNYASDMFIDMYTCNTKDLAIGFFDDEGHKYPGATYNTILETIEKMRVNTN